MRNLFAPILAFIFFFNCSPNNDKVPKSNLIENAVTFDFSFGDDDDTLPEEFLLARPRDVDVDDDGNIYVVDEDRVKVFTNDGKNKNLIGRPGQGPGEFEGATNLMIGNSGFLSVFTRNDIVSWFDADGKFISSKKFERSDMIANLNMEKPVKPFISGFGDKITYLIDEEQYVGFYSFTDMVNTNEGNQTSVLYTSKKGNYSAIKSYHFFNILFFQIVVGPPPNTGNILWDVAAAKTLVYTHSDIEKSNLEGVNKYKLFLYDLDNNTETIIEKTFEPVLEKRMEPNDKPGDESQEVIRLNYNKYYNRVNTHLDDNPYKTPIREILVDGNLIYTITNNIDENNNVLLDVFEIKKSQYVYSIKAPILNEGRIYPKKIKNGKIYYVFNDRETLPTVQVYAIDPKVYAKN